MKLEGSSQITVAPISREGHKLLVLIIGIKNSNDIFCVFVNLLAIEVEPT